MRDEELLKIKKHKNKKQNNFWVVQHLDLNCKHCKLEDRIFIINDNYSQEKDNSLFLYVLDFRIKTLMSIFNTMLC